MFRCEKLFTIQTLVMCAMMAILYPAFAAESDKISIEDIDKISLADLLNLDITVATKTKTRLEDAPSVVSVITNEEIRNMGARDIADVLRIIPGFDITLSPTDPSYQVNIRGMVSSAKNNKVKIMVNGHSLSALWGCPNQLFNVIPIANIQQIEIIRGPGSALYGTGAYLGVINIITKKGGDGASSVSIEGGSFNTIKPYARFSYKKDDVKLSLYADYGKTDGYEETVDSDAFGTIPRSAAPGNTTNNAEYYNFQTDIQYKNFYFSSYFSKIKDELPIGISNALTDEDDIKFSYIYGEIGYHLPVAERVNLEMKIFYDYAEQDAIVEIFSEETSAEIFKWTNGESIFGSPCAENSIIGAEITADYNISDSIQLTAGTSYEYYKQFNSKSYATANIVGKPLVVEGITYQPMEYLGGMVDITENGNWIKDGNRTTYAFYGQGLADIKKLFSLEKGVKTLSLTAGIRYDNYDDFGSTVNPRLGLIYSPTEKLWFKMLYGTAFRAPNFKELYAINNPAVVGNEDLDPETITTVEAFIGYNFTKNIKSSLTFFSVKAEDLILRVPSVTPGTPAVYGNVGSSESRGAEAEFRVLFGRQKYLYFNATWQDVTDTTHAVIQSAGGQIYVQKDFNPAGIPEFYANIGMNYDITPSVNANVWVNYVGERQNRREKMGQ